MISTKIILASLDCEKWRNGIGSGMQIVKICGIKDLDTLNVAVEAGADAIGFMGYAKSKRFIEAGKLSEILKAARCPGVLKVGVFVNPTLEEVKRYVEAGIEAVQLHGDESESFAIELAKITIVWKALGPKTRAEIDALASYPASKFLVDACSPTGHGGTGLKADWNLARYAVGRLPQPVILAGGLTPENVWQAIQEVKPAGVDVSSGVESAPGIKSHALIRTFIKTARGG